MSDKVNEALSSIAKDYENILSQLKDIAGKLDQILDQVSRIRKMVYYHRRITENRYGKRYYRYRNRYPRRYGGGHASGKSK